MKKLEIRKNEYYDSVTLMIISKEVKKMEGVKEALVGMGTELNLELAGILGFGQELLGEVTPNDFFIAADCDSEEAFALACEEVGRMLSRKAEKGKKEYYPPTLDAAKKANEDLNMALISLPGRYAAAVAEECLDKDMHVMLFSDNVSFEEERSLKEYAVEKGLLMMGPDCGTAIVNQVPLAFANVISKGNIGLVCASGTGAQEVSVLIEYYGGGISQLLGTGGRDLKKEIGGIMMKQCLQALIDDPQTEVIVLVSKPPYETVEKEILEICSQAGKPAVVCFIGGNLEAVREKDLYAALSLEDAARKAVALAKGEEVTDFTGFTMGEDKVRALAERERALLGEGQKYIRGLYTGGTLCDEAMKLLTPVTGDIWSNVPLKDEYMIMDARESASKEHTFLDFGDDAFTAGRPHPMIDPSLRAERVLQEAEDEETAVILVDCVIGYGCHEDPAQELSEVIAEIKKKEGHIAVAASVCGTDMDPQNKKSQVEKLEQAGAFVFPSNGQAARFAAMVLEGR